MALVFILGHFGTLLVQSAQADHRLAGSNSICRDNGRYYHVHWERPGGGDRDVRFYLVIWSPNGNESVYRQEFLDSAVEWNITQSFIDFIEAPSGQPQDREFVVSMHNYSDEPFTGRTVLDPNQCNSPQNNETTHNSEDGQQNYILIDTVGVENDDDPDQLRDWVLGHELGHMIGLDHIDNTSALMYRTAASTATSPQSIDLQWLFGSTNSIDPYDHND